MKTLLIVSGGREALHAASLAKRLGHYVVVSDRDMQAPAFAHADSCVIADWRSPDETPAAAERFNRKIRRIDGVMAAEPAAIPAMAETCERLRLPGISSDAARLSGDRLLARERLLAAGIPLPWFSLVATLQALQRIAIERGTPLVIKPADGVRSSAQRVSRAEDLDRAYQTARDQSPTQRVMAEEFVIPPHVTAASLVVNGRCHTVAIADSILDEEHPPFLIRNGRAMPGTMPGELLSRVGQVIAKTAAALGIDFGAMETTLAVRNDQLQLLNIRMGLPPYVCCRQIALSSGLDIFASAIKLALGDSLTGEDVIANSGHPSVVKVRYAPPGRIVGISGEEEARMVPGVTEWVLSLQPGEIIRPEQAPTAAVAVLATGSSREAAERTARDALSLLRIENA
jgi:biotin carboxylase